MRKEFIINLRNILTNSATNKCYRGHYRSHLQKPIDRNSLRLRELKRQVWINFETQQFLQP